MPKTIYVPVGLPGSGKTTWIRDKRLDPDLANSSVVISGDQLRLMFNLGEYRYSKKDTKDIVDSMCEMAIRMLKRYNVIFLDEYYISNTLFDRALLECRLEEHAAIAFVPMQKNLGACIHRRCTDTREEDTSRWPGVLLEMVKGFEPLGHENRKR